MTGGSARIRLGSAPNADSTWVAPILDLDKELAGKDREMVIYGEELIQNTSKYLGPKGSVKQISNGMNCQNCHLDAGTRQWGNNYSAVNSTYPKFRARSNSVEDIHKRINDCFERSLNGSPLDSNSYEMRSIVAYMKWLGKGIEKGRTPHGAGLPVLPFLDRAADTSKGKIVYDSYCQSCHGVNGEGVLNPGGSSYLYPPLWGGHSYNDGAGLYRITKFASYVRNNMPFDQATHQHPVLTDEQAWDVAAFVNSQVRPHKDQSKDWMDISKKAIDEPFGPYRDSFSEAQHKYGPYGPIKKAKESPAIIKGDLAIRKQQ
jgi:thiosulfate dehydrogenase